MPKFIDLTGKKFGRLVVLKRVTNNKHRQSMWLCECDCGKEKIIHGNSLRNGDTKSCGCLFREGNHTKHSQTKNNKFPKIYAVWNNMLDRCTNSNNKGYHNYGGRGITVCQEWLEFANFLKDMGVVPEGYQIDRIDNNKGYYKSNCRWVTRQKQMRNTRRNCMISHDEKKQCLVEWAETTRIPYKTLWHRIYKLNWSIEKALTTPVKKRRKKK